MNAVRISGENQSRVNTAKDRAKDAIKSNPKRSATVGTAVGTVGLGGLAMVSPWALGTGLTLGTLGTLGAAGGYAHRRKTRRNTGDMSDTTLGQLNRYKKQPKDNVTAKEAAKQAAKQAEEADRLLAEEELKSMSFADMIVAIRARGVGEEKIRAALKRAGVPHPDEKCVTDPGKCEKSCRSKAEHQRGGPTGGTNLRDELIDLLDLNTVTTNLEREGLMGRRRDELEDVAIRYGMIEAEAAKLRARDKESVDKVLAQILTKQ